MTWVNVKNRIGRMAVLLLAVVSLNLVGCAPSVLGGLQSYSDGGDGYSFLYPTGWVPVKIANNSGPDIAFHDIIETSENVSVVINPVSGEKSLEELGSPGEVGYQLGKNAIAPPGSNREAELVSAEARQSSEGTTFYTLEYTVKFPTKEPRHNIASVVVHRGKLYTLNASTTEKRWPKLKATFKQMVNSFSVS